MNGPSQPLTLRNSKVRKAAKVLRELKSASLRPLYIEIALHKQRSRHSGVTRDGSSGSNEIDITTTTNDSTSISPIADRSWVEVMFS
jgi:hypothetical protein